MVFTASASATENDAIAPSSSATVAGENAGHLGNLLGRRERLQPFDLDANAIPEQAEFGEMHAQRLDLGGIAAIERGKCGQGIE